MERYHLVLIGAGNAARAVAYALCTKWMPKSLTIVNRDLAKSEELAEFCVAQSPGPTVRVMSINDFIHTAEEPRYRLIIQCTPVGQINQSGDLLTGFAWHETDFAIDLIYNPIRTSFLQNASHAGAKTMNGLGMLIEQAALSQVFWLTGILPDASPLNESEYDSLKEILIYSISS
jgi:shikimate dehydrogenase